MDPSTQHSGAGGAADNAERQPRIPNGFEDDSAAEDAPRGATASGPVAPDCGPGTPGALHPGSPSLPPPTGAGFDVTRQAIGQAGGPPGYNPYAAYPPVGAYGAYGSYGANATQPPPANPYGYSGSYPIPPNVNTAAGAAGGNPYGFAGTGGYGAYGSYGPPPYGGMPGGAGGGMPPPPSSPPPGGGGRPAGFGGLFGESFFQHIDELRARVKRCVIAIVVAACVVGLYCQQLNDYVTRPMQAEIKKLRKPWREQLAAAKVAVDNEIYDRYGILIQAAKDAHKTEEQANLEAARAEELAYSQDDYEGKLANVKQMGEIRTNGPIGPFSYLVDMVLYGALILSSPYLLWELWGFVSPALYTKEKMAVMPIFLFGSVLFLIGAAFGYIYVLPMSFNYLMDLSLWLNIVPWYDLGDYFSFCFTVCLCFGIAFELPLVCIALGKIGILSVRWLLKIWKWFIFGSFVISAILTPPDVMSQFMMAGVLMVLYLISIVGVWIVQPRDNLN